MEKEYTYYVDAFVKTITLPAVNESAYKMIAEKCMKDYADSCPSLIDNKKMYDISLYGSLSDFEEGRCVGVYSFKCSMKPTFDMLDTK
jgi:hypothetical protein